MAPCRVFTLDGQGIGADSGYFCPHGIQKVGEGLDVGFARRVMENGGSFSQGGGTKAVFGGGDGGLIEKDVGTFELFGLDFDAVAGVGDFGA